MSRPTVCQKDFDSLLIWADLVQGDTPREAIERGIRGAIIDGHLKPGTHITQQSVANAFKVSRMPVREALRRLEVQGYLKGAQNKGYVVADAEVGVSAGDLSSLLRLLNEKYSLIADEASRLEFIHRISAAVQHS